MAAEEVIQPLCYFKSTPYKNVSQNFTTTAHDNDQYGKKGNI